MKQCVLLAVMAYGAETSRGAWEKLEAQLEAWPLTKNFAVAVGTKEGNRFTYSSPSFSMDTRIGTASTSKWPLAMMFVGLVQDGTIRSLDSRAHEYVPWWTRDPADAKSNVTLRHLLSFTSGFGGGAPGLAEVAYEPSCMDSAAPTVSYEACARELYETTNLTGTPGTVYAYNSLHLQLAGAIALAASGESDIQKIVAKYLLEPYGMNASSCAIPSARVPQLSVCLETTGADYERFLHATLTRSVLSAELVAESERDYTPFLADFYTLYGDYGFGHFLECFDSPGGFTAECAERQVHCDPGAYGFYPLVDRKLGFYMEIVAYEANATFYPRSGIPEYLRFLVKPLVDAALAGESGATFAHHSDAQAGLSLADVNYIVDCYINPEHCA